ncbi:uncharacterized protein LOC136066150, partial [Quercus suber]|uniref:uncharacterized protein LOC136066150 n=1 Tax=Quercus suber TaxID=58331 RepID=UPI0032DE4CF0
MEGQEISQTGRNGKTVLHRAADLVDLSSLRLILDVAKYKMAIDTPEDNEIRRTALMNVLQSRVTSVTAETRYEAVKVMISNGASTEHTDGIGRSLIHYLAASDDFANILIMLIDDGINLQVQDARGWSPLHVACAHDCPRIVTVLIKSKCPIAVVTKAGLTPLAMAKSVRSNSVIELLLEAQTSSSNEEEQCKQVMQQDLVRTHDHTEKVDVLGNTTLHRAVLYTHDTHEVQRLLKSGQTDINSVNMYKQTALHLALQRLDQCTSAEEEDEREQDTAISI